MYLSSGSGCDQFLLLSGAVQVRPAGNGRDPKAGLEYLADVQSLHLDVDGNQGVAVWADSSAPIVPLMAMRFSIDAQGGVSSDPLGPQVVYWPPNGYRVYSADVHLNEFGAMEVVVVERAADDSEWRLAHVNLDNGIRSSLAEGTCPFQDASGACYQPMRSVP